MASQAELENALRNAVDAGDSEAATRLADALHVMSEPNTPEVTPSSYKPGMGDMFIRGATGGLSDYVGAAGEYTGNKLGQGIQTLQGKPQLPDLSYNDALKDVRAGNAQYRDQSPVSAYGSEVVGGVVSPIYGAIGKGIGMAADAAKALPWAKNLLQGAGLGFTGSVGNAEGQGGGLPTAGDLNNAATVGTDLGLVLPVALNPLLKGVGWAAGKAGSAVQAALDKLPFNQDSVAGRKIAENLARDSITPEQLATNRAALGPGANVVDAAGSVDPNSGVWLGGRNTFGMADALANQPGQTQDVAERVLKPRAAQAGTDIISAADQHLAPGSDLYGSINELTKQRSATARPLYEQAFGPEDTRPIKSDLVDRLMSRPLFQRGLREGVSDVLDENAITGGNSDAFKTYLEGENLDDPNLVIKKAPTLRVLDAAKRGLDGMLSSGGEEIRNPVTGILTKKGMRIDQMRSTLVDELDSATGGEAGAYSQARKAWAGPSAMIDATQKGRAFMNGDPEATMAVFNKLSPDEQNMFRMGASREVQASVEKTGQVPAALRNILNPASKQRQLMTQIFPNFDNFLQSVGGVVRKGETAKMLKGSQTAGRFATQSDLGLDLGGALIDAGTGNVGGAARNLARGAANWFTGPSEGAKNAMGRMLLDPQAFDQTINSLNTRAKTILLNHNALTNALLNSGNKAPALLGGAYSSQYHRP